MRYLKTFENFSFGIEAEKIESSEYFLQVSDIVDTIPEFNELVDALKKVDLNQVETVLSDYEFSSKELYKEIETYKLESMHNIDTQNMAREALKYLSIVGIVALLVKVFYKVADIVFTRLDEAGWPAVAGGVLVILLYLAFLKAKGGSNVEKDDEYTDYEEM